MMAATLDTLTPTVAQDQTVDQNQQDVITNSVLNKENGGVNEDENNDPRDNGNPDPSAHNSESEEDTESSQKIISLPPTFRNTHPLKSKWTFWYLNNDKGKDWMDRLKNVCTLTSVEEFWAFVDKIRSPSHPSLIACDYNLFKGDIQPLWEVEENKFGGRLMIQIEKSRPELLDLFWIELLMACIGEAFEDDTSQVCGAVCNIRGKGHKLSLWTTDSRAIDANKRIGTVLKQRYREALAQKNYKERDGGPRLVYQDHLQVQRKESSKDQYEFSL